MMRFMNWLRQHFGHSDELSPRKVRNNAGFKRLFGR